MKLGLFMTMAATALILAGCSNDENGMDNGLVELRLTSGVTAQTRAYTATQSNTISRDEVVSVWVNDAGTATTATSPLYKAVQLTANGSNGFTGETMYFPGTGNNIDIYAVHGNFTSAFTPGNAFPTSDVEYKVETNQSATADYTKSDLLYAYKKDVARSVSPVQLDFYHMLSKLELAIKKGDGAPDLATSAGAVKLNGVTLNGKFTPSTAAAMGEQSQRAAMLGNANTATIDDMILGQKTCTDFDANVEYNEAILVPQDMGGKELKFALQDGGELTYIIPSGTTFESGKKYQYHITLNLTGIKVTSRIEDWVPTGTVNGGVTM